ncbi:MAG: sigma-70 family RNA polymerase sigma factor, partial [Myxococcales bacterium]|nr:sigma-70 family RNA polymerase sigma factor [Myxococcales bacterium]
MSERSKYEIGTKLGQGGMAETFEAMRAGANGHGFRVALKQVLPELLGRSKDKEREFLQRFSQEARIGAKLDHPNIVRVVDTGVLGGRPYLAMELVDGVSLSRLFKVCRRNETLLPSFVVLHIACDVAAALEYAHRHGVLHRDVTPGNVLLSKSGQCKLSDFGIARVLSDDLGLTRTRAFMGKIPYVAPEVFHGDADARSDLYSLGVTITEAAIGQRLFPSPTVEEGLLVRRRTDVERLVAASRDDLPEGFADMMGRLTSQDPSARPTAEEALDAFEDLAGRTTTTAEHALSHLVFEAARENASKDAEDEPQRKGGPPTVAVRVAPKPKTPPESTASVMQAGDQLVQGVVKRVTAGLDVPTDARDEFVAQGRLGLLEAHREFDPKHPSAADFLTFAFPRVERRVQEGFAAIVGIPRGVYRGAKKRAATARKHARDAQQVNTKEYVAHKVHDGADKLHGDPFTTIGHRREKNAVRAAIELLPDAQQRQVLRLMYVDGLAQSEVCEVLQLSKTRISRFHSAGVET